MAAIPKISAETIEEVTGTIKKAVDDSDVESVAKSLNIEVKDVQKLVEGKAPKGLVSSVFEAAGGTVKILQGKLDTALGRATPPPAVAQEFRTESLGKETGYTPPSPIGGPLFRTRRGALTPLPENVEAEDVPTPLPNALANIQENLQATKPPVPPPPAAKQSPQDTQLSKKVVTTAGVVATGAGGAGVIAKNMSSDDKPLAQQADAGQATQATDAKNVQEVVDLAAKAAPVLPTQLAQKAKENAEKIKTIEDLLADVEARKQRKVDRIELLQAIETMTHGLVTAIGAGVLLNRNSPFAVDFSKGPKVDWAAQLDRLQKDFDTQTNALIKKYGIDQEMKAKQEAAVESKRRHEERMGLEREKLELEKTKAGQQQAEKQAKLTAAEQKQYNTNLKHYGDLRKAITEKKPGAAEDAATLLGADETTLQNLKTAMNQGMWDKVLNTLGISESPTTEQVLQGLRPKKPAAPAAAAPAVQLPSAIIDPEGKKITRPSNITDEVWKQSIDNIESHWNTQNKLIKKEY